MDPQQLIDTFQALSSQIQALQEEIKNLKQSKTDQPPTFPHAGAASSSGETLTSRVDLTKLGKSPKQFDGTA